MYLGFGSYLARATEAKSEGPPGVRSAVRSEGLEVAGRAIHGVEGPPLGPSTPPPWASAAESDLNRPARVNAPPAVAAVETATAAQQIGPTVPREFVIPDLTKQPIAVGTTSKLIEAGATVGTIASAASKDIIPSASSTNHVVAATADNVVVPCARNDDIPTRRAHKLVWAGCTDDRRSQPLALRSPLSSRRSRRGEEGGRN